MFHRRRKPGYCDLVGREMRLWNVAEKLSREVFDTKRQSLDSRFVGPIEILSQHDFAEDYFAVISRVWEPIAGTFYGSMIERYVTGIIAEPGDHHSPASRTVTSTFWIHEAPGEVNPVLFTSRLLRRAIFIRQLRSGVRRNLLDQSLISTRTDAFIAARYETLASLYRRSDQEKT